MKTPVMMVLLAGWPALASGLASADADEFYKMVVEVVPSPNSAGTSMRMMVEQTIIQALMETGFVEVRSSAGSRPAPGDEGGEEAGDDGCGAGIRLIYEIVAQTKPGAMTAKGVLAKVVISETGEVLAEGQGEARPAGDNSALAVTERAMKPLVEKLRAAARRLAREGRGLSIVIHDPPKGIAGAVQKRLESLCASVRPIARSGSRFSLDARCRQDSLVIAGAIEEVLAAAAGSGRYEIACASPFVIVVKPAQPAPRP